MQTSIFLTLFGQSFSQGRGDHLSSFPLIFNRLHSVHFRQLHHLALVSLTRFALWRHKTRYIPVTASQPARIIITE